MAIPVGTAVGYLDLDYSQFSKKLNTAIEDANGLSNKFSDTFGAGLSTIGEKIASVGTKLTTSLTVPLAAAMAASVKFGAEFDKGMSNVKAVSGATTEEFEAMRDAAIDWGEKTVYTATEATDALYYMGLAGWDAQESMAGLGPVLNLAAAGNLELGRTSDIVTDGMTAMQVAADGLTNGINNTEHFTNVLAATMSNSNTDVDQLGEAFKYVAPLAGAAGMEIDDLGLALGLMADVGVKASQAGTGLRQALKNVISPTDKMQAAMDKFGVSLFDAEGNAKSMRQFMLELRDTFGDLAVDVYDANGELKTAEDIMAEYGHSLPTTQQEKLNAIVEIFGTRALPGVLGIIEQSDERFEKLANAIDSSDKAFVRFGDELMTYDEAVSKFGEDLVNTSKEFEILGYAEGMAETQMDNLQGDWVRFQSALGTTKIEIIDLVNGALREFVQKLTELVKWFNDLDDEQQQNILKWAGVIAAIGPVLLVFGKLIKFVGDTITAVSKIKMALDKISIGFQLVSRVMAPTIGAFKNLFTVMGPIKGTLGLIQAALSAIASPIGVAVIVIGTLVAAFVHLMKTNEEFRTKVFDVLDGVKEKFSEAGKKILDAINKIGFDFTSLKEALSAAFDWFANFVGPLLLGILDTVAGTIGGIIDIVTGLFEIIGGLFAGFRDGDWSMFTQGLLDFFGGLLEVITLPFRLAFNIITEILAAFGVTWTDVWNGIKDFFTGVWESVTTTFTNAKEYILEKFTEIKDYFTQVKENISLAMDNFKEVVIGTFIDVLSNTIAYVIRIKNGIVTRFTEIKEEVKEKVEELKTGLQEKFESIKNLVTTVFTLIKNYIVNKFMEIYNNVTKYVEELKNSLRIKVTEIYTTFVNKFTEMKNKVVSIVTSLKNTIINIFSNIRDEFKTIGSNIINGIWDGISAGWDWLTGKVRDLANSLFQAAKDALGIESPSKVFRDGVGRWIPPGIVEGVEDAMPEAADEIQDIINDNLSDIDAEVEIDNPLIDILDTTQTAINDVTYWFASVEERLKDIVADMRQDLLDLISMKDLLVTSDGMVIEVNKESPSETLKPIGQNGESGNTNTVNNYYYTFNSPKAIDEIEASRKLKETQRDLSEGF